ncbi:ABC transporter ATP-binding protein [Rhodovulum sulfidophilum]|uniref:ABC transporter ATP-binding protein n=1 Tax=Rhodovulum sulfidophilum TaxID=35806 RepID=A0ABS1RW40_RHOSU|nr:ABC transporter ATP-binding protein [Rhodovulum sulfidophilum]MBL3610138.1 ABC transporter ATP-binding protein [Rhodovulum sulfidophilum]MCE8456895.1 ABC transporter ATP-binding protein [Rhodovulum sulfidophilum]
MPRPVDSKGLPVQLEVSGVSVRFGRRIVLRDVSLPALRAGEIMAFVGPNGAGKSTLLKAIAGVVASEGEMRLGEDDLRALPPASRMCRVGYMPQSQDARTGLSVLEAVLAGLDLLMPGLSRGERRARAAAALVRLGLEPLAGTSLCDLSGGQRQLAVLAQSLSHDPVALLLDEPTAALDIRHQYEVMEALRGIAAGGRIVALVLHDLALAAQWADRIVFVKDGGVYASGRTRDCLTAENIRNVFEVEAEVLRDGGHGVHINVLGRPRPA